VTARGISCELLKYAKDDGFVCRTRDKDVAIAVAMILGPHPHELETVTEAITELVTDEFLRVENGCVYIKNFGEAQERRTPAAVRQKRYRESKSPKDLEQTRNEALCPVTSRPGNALLGSETKRNETKRSKKEMSAHADEPTGLTLAVQEPEAETKAPLPFSPDEAVGMLAKSSAGRFVASTLNRGHVIHLAKLIRRYPERETWMRIGGWIGSGGDSWAKDGFDIRAIGHFEVWEAKSRAPSPAKVPGEVPRARMQTAEELLARRKGVA
jgi:hypothetical protein